MPMLLGKIWSDKYEHHKTHHLCYFLGVMGLVSWPFGLDLKLH